ncbi:MAG: hypothetical protein JWQ21_3193 [Herminiimonas sp.]|nr:hypothetical protein [Herminiimonas sp.]
MTKMQASLKVAIDQAAEAQKVPMAKACAASQMAEARQQAIEDAERDGVKLYIPRIPVLVQDGREKWPSTLAEILCERPALACEANQTLMLFVSERLGLSETLQGNSMSKTLSVRARNFVQHVLASYGYDGSRIVKGTDIKRVVKNEVRLGTSAVQPLTTTFEADSIVLDGQPYKYRHRERKATEQAWHDFSIRISGVDVPLIAVLRLRNIGIGAFMAADEAALKCANPDSVARRKAINRQLDTQPRTRRRVEESGKPHSKAATDEFLGSELAGLARHWWNEMPLGRRANMGYWDMVQHLKGVGSTRSAIDATLAKLDAWVASFPDGDAPPAEEEAACQN